MKLKLSILFILFGAISKSQNIAPNANFEAYIRCPSEVSDFSTLSWISPFWPGTPDYFNECNDENIGIPTNDFGLQESSTGRAYVGLYTYGYDTREFIQGALLTPTIAGVTYELTIVYSPADNFGHADGLGMLLSVGPPEDEIGQIPQMSKSSVTESQSEWHTLTFEYLSPGGETHVTIGNFNNDVNSTFVPDGMYQQSAYYYIDSIMIRCIGEASDDIVVDLGDDVSLCDIDYPYTLVSNVDNAYNEWSTGDIGASIDIVEPGVYYLKSTIDCKYGIDTIVISDIDVQQDGCLKENVYIPNVFSPNYDGVNDFFFIGISERWLPTSMEMHIYDRWGNQVFYSEDSSFLWDGTFNGKLLQPNAYFYSYELGVNVNGSTQMIEGTGSLTILY